MNNQYVAHAGLHGYMPNCSEVYDSYLAAVESMALLHELGRRRRAQLRRDGYLELNLHRDGNEYIEIVEGNSYEPDSENS